MKTKPDPTLQAKGWWQHAVLTGQTRWASVETRTRNNLVRRLKLAGHTVEIRRHPSPKAVQAGRPWCEMAVLYVDGQARSKTT